MLAIAPWEPNRVFAPSFLPAVSQTGGSVPASVCSAPEDLPALSPYVREM